jgi:drug/metabolite transporter (DMT)-like permease
MIRSTQAAYSPQATFAARLRVILRALDLRIPAAIAITVFVWASAFPAIRAGLAAYAPAHLALLRFLVASAALAIMALGARLPLPRLRDLPAIAALGFLGVPVYHLALNTGEMSVPAGVASVIIGSAPATMALLAAVFLKERLRVAGWLGIGASFAGVALIALTGEEGLSFDARALLVVLAATSQAVFFVSQKPLLATYGAFRLTAYVLWAGTAMLLVFVPGLAPAVRAAPLDATLAAIYLGVFPSALGYAMWAYVLSRIPASRASSFIYLIPALAILLAWSWLGEVPSLFALGGGALVLAGVVAVNTWGKVTPAARSAARD